MRPILGSLAVVLLGLDAAWGVAAPDRAVVLENDDVRLVIAGNGRTQHFIDRRTGQDCCKSTAFASLYKGGKRYDATAVAYSNGRLTVTFGKLPAAAVYKVAVKKRYFVFEVVSVSDPNIESFRFLHLALEYTAPPKGTFAACALALNLRTRVSGLLRPSKLLLAQCYPRFGMVGAKAAVVACAQSERRQVLKDVVSHAPDLPQSSVGGPWAWDASISRGSYLFAGGNVSEKTVDQYIRLAQRLGIDQLNLYAARYGDWQVYPRTYPRGRASLKAVIDKIHAAGMKAGLHTYSCFINKASRYVTPQAPSGPGQGRDLHARQGP